MIWLKLKAHQVQVIGQITLRELLREKLFYGALGFAAFLLGVSVLASNLTYAQPERILVDYGISGLHLSLHWMGVLLAANLIPREIERRTAHLVFSRPVSGSVWLLGKFLGLTTLLFLIGGLLSLVLLGMLKMLAGGGESFISSALVQALLLSFVSSLMLSALTLGFSAFSTRAVSIFWGLGLYGVCGNLSQLRALQSSKDLTPLAQWIFKGLVQILPDLERFSLGFRVTYRLDVPWSYSLHATAYGLVWCLIGWLVAGHLLQKREL